jgi:hypothetical protein
MKFSFIIFILPVLFLATTFTTSFAQIYWSRNGGNPVLSGDVGEWDELFVQHSSVIFDGNKYHMWYYGESAIPDDGNIGHATSQDGIFWIKDSLNPVLTKGSVNSWDDYYVFSPSVLYDGFIFHMWYTGVYHNDTDGGIGYATSSDGTNWAKYNDPMTTGTLYAESDPVLIKGSPGSWDEDGVEVPAVILEGNSYTMWYLGYISNPWIYGIGRATSTDGINWTKYDDPATPNSPFAESDPVLYPGSPGSWDYPFLRLGSVVFDGTKYHLYYYGGIFYVNFRIGYAWSSDGINWTKYNDPDTPNPPFAQSDPVLTWGLTGSWDDTQVMAPWVILDTLTSTYKMWYTGADDVPLTGIGYATAPDCTFTGLFEIEDIIVPAKFVLQQNYPNPFNPSTTIEFSIQKSEFVTLKIYNLLGQEVAELVSERMKAGSYNYSWDASGFASGVYIYKIQAGAYQHVRKMVYLK